MRRDGGGLGLGTALCVLAMAAPAASARDGGRILVSLHDPASASGVLGSAGARADGPRVPQIGLVTVRPTSALSSRQVLAALRADPRVRAVAREGRFALRFRPNDPAMRIAHPDREAVDGAVLQWSVERQGLLRAWDVTRGEGARVAIIDTGVDADHPDLAGKVVAAVDLDDGAPGGADEDSDGHGTHVASLACAATDNEIGIAGAGFDCSIISIKTDLTDSSVAAGIVAAADHGAHAINMSFGDSGGERSPAIADAIDYAVRRGAVVVAAAADEPVAEQGEPANLLQPSGTGSDLGAGSGLVVTAADSDDDRAYFAGRGSQISMAAYGATHSPTGGRGLFAAYPAGLTEREVIAGCGCRASLDGDERWAFLPGTSMAAPQVAAVAAMVRRMNPDLSAAEVVRILKATARQPARARWNNELGWGILDAGRAVEAARRVDRRAPASTLRVRRRRAIATLTWNSSDPARAPLQAAGVVAVEIWMARDGAAPRRLARRGPVGSVRVRVRRNHRYEFHTVAVDRAGNREVLAARPDASLRL